MIGSLAKSNVGPSIFTWMIFAVPALALTIGPGIGLVEAVILIGTLIYFRPLWLARVQLFRPARWIVLAFALHFAVTFGSLLWSGFKLSSMDNSTRLLLTAAAIGLIGLHKPKAELFWHGLFVGTICAMGIALYQRFGLGMERAEGFHMAIMFGDIAIAMGIMALASVKVFARTRYAFLPYIAFLAGATASVLSSTRGGWIALIFSFLPLYLFDRRAVGKKFLLVLATGCVLLAGAYFIPHSEVRERLQTVVTDVHQYNLGDVNTSVGTRLEMWKASRIMFLEHPWTGVGHGHFQRELNEMIDKGTIDPSVQIYKHAHNEMLHALATKGVIGAITLVFLYSAPLIFFRRHMLSSGPQQPYALAGFLLVMSYIAFGLTQVLFTHHIGSAFYGAAISVLAGICRLPALASCGAASRLKS